MRPTGSSIPGSGFVLGLTSHLALFLLLLAAAPALATTSFTFSTSDSEFDPGVANQGWYPSFGTNSDLNDNYIVGTRFSQSYRNFFTFDLTTLPTDLDVLSATLRLQRFFSSETNEAVETLELFDVSTDPATLNDNVGANAAIYADLGSGTSYGAFDVPGADPPTFVVLEFSLNAAGLGDIEAAAGGCFSIGGTLASADDDDSLFAFSSRFVQELVVVAVPEPGTGTLLLFGLLGLARRGRRPRV